MKFLNNKDMVTSFIEYTKHLLNTKKKWIQYVLQKGKMGVEVLPNL